VTAQALTLFDRLTGTGGKAFNRPSRGGIRRTKSVAPDKAELPSVEGLVKNGAAGNAAAPPKSAGMVSSE
jgi:hypothetical protein